MISQMTAIVDPVGFFKCLNFCHPVNKYNSPNIPSFCHVSLHPEISALFLNSLNSGSFRQISKECHQVGLCWAMQHLCIGNEKWSWHYWELTLANSLIQTDAWSWFGYHYQASKELSVFRKIQYLLIYFDLCPFSCAFSSLELELLHRSPQINFICLYAVEMS